MLSTNINENLIMMYMQTAIELAKEAYKHDEVPVGSIIIKDKKIIGKGFNTSLRDRSVTAHAEINAINDASKTINNYRLENSIIFTTLEPCHMCAKAIVDARIDLLIFGAREPKTGAIISVDNFFKKDFLNHRVEFREGYLKDESSKLLKSFFSERRKNK